MKTLWILPLVVLSVVITVAAGFAQEIRVTRRPATACGPDAYLAYDSWWVSAALRDDVEASMLGSRFGTLAEAQAYAHQWIASNHSSSPPGSWTRIKFIEIEGEGTCRCKDGPALPSFEDIAVSQITEVVTDALKAKKAVDKVIQKIEDPKDVLATSLAKRLEPGGVGSVLSNYMKAASKSYERAKQLKEQLLAGQSRATDQAFSRVNAAIDDYNKNRDALVHEAGGQLTTMPRMTRVTPTTLTETQKWAEAVRMENQLRAEQEQLEKEKAALEEEFTSLGNLGRECDRYKGMLRQTRQRSRGPGPFRARPPGDVVVDGVFLGFRHYDDYADARQFAGPSGIVVDANGNSVREPPVISVTEGDVDRAATMAESKKLELEQRTAAYEVRLADYESRLSRLQARLVEYKEAIASLRQHAYERPTFPK